MSRTITYRDPSELKLHPALKVLPELPNDHPDFIAIVDDIRDRGIDYPVIILNDQIVDGRHRWRAATRLQLKELPTRDCKENEVAGIIVNSLLQRRHFTKGALAYMAFPLMEDAWKEAQARQQAALKAGSSLSVLRGKTVEDMAENLGFSRTLFFQARDVHQAFEKKPKLREEFEADILTGDIGLGAVKAGIAGQESTKGKPKVKEDQLELFTGAFDTLHKRFRYWNKFDDGEKDEVRKSLRKAVADMPADLRAEFKKAIAAIDKAEKEEK